jgi:hypothetical protein
MGVVSVGDRNALSSNQSGLDSAIIQSVFIECEIRVETSTFDKDDMDILRRVTMKRFVLFCMISFAFLTGCQSISTSTPTSIPVVSMASYPSAVLGVVIDQAGKVLYVEPGSAAERAGIARDDVLQKVNNFSVKSAREQVRSAIQAAKGEQIVIVLLKPNGNVTVMNLNLSASAPQAGNATATPLPALDDYL